MLPYPGGSIPANVHGTPTVLSIIIAESHGFSIEGLPVKAVTAASCSFQPLHLPRCTCLPLTSAVASNRTARPFRLSNSRERWSSAEIKVERSPDETLFGS